MISLLGMPMVIYSQILMWGQSSCCLLAICVLNSMGSKIPPMFAAMVPLGNSIFNLLNRHAVLCNPDPFMFSLSYCTMKYSLIYNLLLLLPPPSVAGLEAGADIIISPSTGEERTFYAINQFYH
jgi:hypothetical protein